MNARDNLEAKSLEAARDITRKRLAESKGKNVTQWEIDNLAVEDYVVEDQDKSVYVVPSGWSNFIGDRLASEMTNILSIVRDANTELAGMRVSQTQVLLADDDTVHEIESRLRRWADDYVALRLSKTIQRDRNPVKQFQHIYKELLPLFDAIAFRKNTMHRCFLAEFTDYLAWRLYEQTWKPVLEIVIDAKTLSRKARVLPMYPEYTEYMKHMVQVYSWNQRDDLAMVLERLCPSDEAIDEISDEADIKRRLRLLVSDIQEMRPFLIHNFNPLRAITEVGDGVFVSWYWDTGRGTGFIPVGASLESMQGELHGRTSRISLTLKYDGLLALYKLPWLGIADIHGDSLKLLAANLCIVGAIHAKLWSFYEKIDIDAILARWRKREPGGAEEPTEEEIAASCRTIAEQVVDDEVGAPTTRTAGSLKALRMQRLLTVLSERLNCDVRSSKGSEIVVFRSGGHHFTLGHHKVNTHVPAAVIKNLLQRVGISFDEWLRALDL